MMGDVPKAEVLLANGAILETRGQVGWSGLMHAACRGHAEMTHWLISQGADLQAFNVLKETALTLAAQFGNTDCVRILLEAGAPMRHGRSHPAIARAGNTEVVRLLVDAGADIDARGDNNFAWPLKVAAESDDIQFARQLLDMGADVNRDSIGETALHTAAKRDHLEIVSLLLQRGANPDASDCDMYTPLMYAESLECINLLLAAGADIHAFDCAGAEVVRHYEDPEFIDRLLALGATWDEEKPYP